MRIKRPRRKAVIFDLDGTLLNSIDGLILANQQAATELGLRVPATPEFKRYLLRGLEHMEIVRSLWPDVNPADVQRVATRHTCEMRFREVPGAASAVRAVRQAQMAAVLHTSRRADDNVVHHLKGIGLRRHDFDHIHAVEDETPAKSDPAALRHLLARLEKLGITKNLQRAWVVGDTTREAELALEANCGFIGVLTGVATAEDFESFRHREHVIIVNAIDDVENLLYAL